MKYIEPRVKKLHTEFRCEDCCIQGNLDCWEAVQLQQQQPEP